MDALARSIVFYGALYIAAFMLALDTGIKRSPDLLARARFVRSAIWGFLPLVLLLIFAVLQMYSHFFPVSPIKELQDVNTKLQQQIGAQQTEIGNQHNQIAKLQADNEATTKNKLAAQRTDYEAKLTDAQGKINALNKQAADRDQNLARSQAAASDWQLRYVDVVTRIAGKDFAMSLFNAQFQTDMSKALAEQADAELALAQTRWEKKLMPMPPRDSQQRAQEAHASLNEAQVNLEHWNSVLKAKLTSAIACTKK